MDRKGTVFYSTAPGWISMPTNKSDEDWCDHWKQCVWFVPGQGIPIYKDQEVHLCAVHDETRISYNINTHSRIDAVMCGFKGGDFQLELSPERIAIYGDGEWRSFMSTVIRNTLKGRVDPLCVVADDSVFLTLLVAHLSQTSKVISLFPGLQGKGVRYIEAVADANGISMDRIQVLEKNRTLSSMLDTHQKKVDLLIGEPFYSGTEGMLPWQKLRFWKEKTMLGSLLSEAALIVPCKGILKACAMSLPDLWNSRRCLDKIEGFDHSVINTTLGACGELPAHEDGPCLPYFIWQTGKYKKLSDVFTIMEFDFSKPISPSSGRNQVEFVESGMCHGFALWIDWLMDSDNSMLSTGPDKRHWKQGVKLLAKPVAVGIHGSSSLGECCHAVIEASFDPSNGELLVRHGFS